MHYQEWRTELTQERIANTERLVANTDQQFFITNKILPLLKIINETPNIDIASIQQNYLEKYDLDISIYLFDIKGNLEEVIPKRAPNQWLMKNLFPYLIEKDLKKIEAGSKLLDKKIEFSFGYGKNLISLRDNSEKILFSLSAGQDCFFTWTKRTPKSLMIFGHRLPSTDKIIQIEEEKISKNKDLLCVGKLSNIIKTEKATKSIEAYKYLSNKSLDFGTYNNQEWYFSSNKNGDVFYCSYKSASSIYSRGLLYLKFLFIIIIPLFLFIIIKTNRNTDLSLKQMVLLIFLASSMIPLGTISSESFENIETYSEIYKNELKSSMEGIINNCIQNFENYLALRSNQLNNMIEPENGIYNFEKIEQNILKEFPDTKISLRDAACEQIYTNYPQYSSGQDTLYKALGRIYMNRYNKERINELPYNGNIFAEEMVSREDLGLSIITNEPNKLQFVYNSGIKMLVFIKALPKEAGKPAILYCILNIQNTINDYIKSIDKRTLVFNQQQINLTALDVLGFKWIIPPNSNKNQYLEQAKTAFITGKPIYREIKQNKNSLCSLCISNSGISDVCYTGTVSKEKLEREIKNKKNIIIICTIISLIMFYSITLWIISQLINPIGELEKGVIALEKRNYETQISVPPGKDEFVQLFKEFNHMMGENYDMQMAKNVQEGIITNVFPQANNFIIDGNTFAVDKLNGNCLTSFKLPDGKILFLIGNVTGTSIGSALMSAFIRSITFHWCQKEQVSPVPLIEAINKMLSANKMKNMLIGIVCGILDTETGIIKFVTKGHIFPLFLRKDKRVEWLGQPSFPMGAGKNKEIKQLETKLEPNERLLCITKGIIEINNSTTTGYELIEKWAVQTSAEKETDWLNQIKSKFDEWCRLNNTKPTDDITLFSIISKPQEGKS